MKKFFNNAKAHYDSYNKRSNWFIYYLLGVVDSLLFFLSLGFFHFRLNDKYMHWFIIKALSKEIKDKE